MAGITEWYGNIANRLTKGVKNKLEKKKATIKQYRAQEGSKTQRMKPQRLKEPFW